MIIYILLGLSILFAVSVGILAILLVIFIFQSDIKGAPFVDNKFEVIQTAIEQLELTEHDTFCDLGSGSGQVLSYVCKNHPNIKVIGVEAALIPYFISKWKLRKYLSKNLEIHRADIRNFDLSKCNRVYLYLFPRLISELSINLLPKINDNSIRCVSCVFPIPEFEPKKQVKVYHPLFKKRVSVFVY